MTSKDSDQSVRRLVRAFVGRTYHIVGDHMLHVLLYLLTLIVDILHFPTVIEDKLAHANCNFRNVALVNSNCKNFTLLEGSYRYFLTCQM